jgi:hypothetical protein
LLHQRTDAKNTPGLERHIEPFGGNFESDNPGKDYWSPECRLAVFALSSTSILSLLTRFYRVCSMRMTSPFL